MAFSLDADQVPLAVPTAQKAVVTQSTDQGVLASSAVQDVDAVAPVENIISWPSAQHVVAAEGGQVVVTRTAVDEFVDSSLALLACCGLDHIGVIASLELLLSTLM